MIIILNFLFVLTSFVALYVSSASRGSSSISIIISNVSILIGLFYLFKLKTKIKIPKNFYLMLIFNIILFLYSFFVKDKLNPLYYALTFEVSLFYWIIFYNLESSRKIIRLFIIGLPIVASILYLLKVPSLFFIDLSPDRHYHIGDLWALTIILLIYENFIKIDVKKIALIIIGFIFLIISSSRSSYISLIAGVTYTYNLLSSKNKNLIFICMISSLALILFMTASINKTLLSRPYFTQSIESISKYPLGVGMGNFGKISLDYFTLSNNKSVYTIYAHSLYLEAISGVGVLSIFFLIFIIKSIIEILKYKRTNSVWAAIFLAISINFMFDVSYSIPGMIWIWFMVYGTFQKEENNTV